MTKQVNMMVNATKVKWRPAGSTFAGWLLSIACAGLGCLIVSFVSPTKPGLSGIALFSTLDAENRNASEVISQDILCARSLERHAANELVLRSLHGIITYTFDGARHSLTRVAGSKSEKLLAHVDSFSFSLLAKNQYRADGALVPASPCNARAVACGWASSWKLAGARLDSNEMRMAAILLRNR